MATAQKHDTLFPGYVWPDCGMGEGEGREALLHAWYGLLDEIYQASITTIAATRRHRASGRTTLGEHIAAKAATT